MIDINYVEGYEFYASTSSKLTEIEKNGNNLFESWIENAATLLGHPKENLWLKFEPFYTSILGVDGLTNENYRGWRKKKNRKYYVPSLGSAKGRENADKILQIGVIENYFSIWLKENGLWFSHATKRKGSDVTYLTIIQSNDEGTSFILQIPVAAPKEIHQRIKEEFDAKRITIDEAYDNYAVGYDLVR